MTDFSDQEFDVIGFAKSLMSEIESIRSFKNVKDDKTGEGFQLPTESRVNAFFRLLGLPYFVSITNKDKSGNPKQSILQPGFGITVRSSLAGQNINDSNITYIDVNGNFDDLDKVLVRRVYSLSDIANKMGTEKMNERIAKAMYDPINIVANYPDDLSGVAKLFTPKILANEREVFKSLFPLIPSISDNKSYRVLPLLNEVARPFLSDVKERMVDRDTVLRKPFLEQVIRIRFVTFESSNNESQKLVEKNMTNSLKKLLGDEGYAAVFGDAALFSKIDILEEFVIKKFLGAIRNLAKRWVKINEERLNLLRQIKPNIVIKTASARESAYGKRIELSINLDGTKEGEMLKVINQRIALDEAIIAILPSDEDEKTNIKQSGTKNIIPNALQTPFIDLLTFGLKKNKEKKGSLETRIEKNIKNLEKIRLEIVDLMTGEFTGLSVPDVIMVMTAFFVVEKTYLLDLLDEYAITSMKSDPVLNTIVKNVKPSANNAMEAIGVLEKVVDMLFQLFQKEVEIANNRKTKGQQGVRKSVYNNKSSEQPVPPTDTVYDGEK